MSGRMNYTGVRSGTAMQTHRIGWRIAPHQEPGAPSGEKLLSTEDIPTIRRLLRTDMTLDEIGAQVGTSRLTLQKFIKRRNLCNLKARRDFITLQRSLARLPEPT